MLHTRWVPDFSISPPALLPAPCSPSTGLHKAELSRWGRGENEETQSLGAIWGACVGGGSLDPCQLGWRDMGLSFPQVCVYGPLGVRS